MRRWGNAADGGTEILTGTYNFEGEVGRRLLDVLPMALVLRADEWQTPVLPLLAAEIPRDEVVGQPPMEFLTHWRLTLAADLLLDPRETVASVASAVGYSSPYALSAAFKRVRGVAPRQHRTATRALQSLVEAGKGSGDA